MISNLSEKTDEEVVRLVKQGDKESFGVLITRFEEKLKRYGRKFLSDREDITDIVQEIFIKTYQNIQSFDEKQRFSPWLYRIAHNSFINEWKKGRLRPITLFDFDTLLAHLTYDDPVVTEREQSEIKQMINNFFAV